MIRCGVDGLVGARTAHVYADTFAHYGVSGVSSRANRVDGSTITLVKPTQNGFIESFNGRLRAECLNGHLFASLPEAHKIIEEWSTDYNTLRPHTSLDGTHRRSLQGHNQNRFFL